MDLLKQVGNLKQGKIKETIDKRIQEFKELGKKSNEELFKELCFCILTANFNAERSILIQSKIGNDFITLSREGLAKKLEKLGHRFPNARAKYIVEAREHIDCLKDLITDCNEIEVREWLVKNVKGLGYKEASHFLRNIGFDNVAIIDFHIVGLLNNSGLFECKRPSCKAKYFEIEGVLRKLAKKLDFTLAELDLYLWYIETGKVLK
ncbi:MAG: N-glycosylase/DNA lyase [Candidatus Woesearchaeota archaeon]|nr:MAG: N-glycosylase/DNA lyase [Candidatus Woesearchaeota archaeon]